ncbi:MAG: hypothetical protein NUW37_04550 [Planctomycetes bacterium]|nr:hypothetical protein [Planctomycetota bacterium]
MNYTKLLGIAFTILLLGNTILLAEEAAEEESSEGAEEAAEEEAPAEEEEEVDELQQRIDAAVERALAERDSGNDFFTKKGAEFSLSGKFEVNFHATRADTHRQHAAAGVNTNGYKDNTDPQLYVDRFLLTPRFDLDAGFYGVASLEFRHKPRQTDTFWLDEAYVGWSSQPKDKGFYFFVGIRAEMSRLSRISESYSLLSAAFDRDEDASVNFGGDYDLGGFDLLWRVGYADGMELSTRGAGQSGQNFPSIADKRKSSVANTASSPDWTYNLGFNLHFEDKDHILFLVHGKHSRLSDNDLAFLKGGKAGDAQTAGGYHGYPATDESKRQERYGALVDAQFGDLNFTARWMGASDGKLRRTAYYFQPFYKIEVGAEGFNSIGLLYRYGSLTNDLAVDGAGTSNFASSSISWDRGESVVGVVIEFAKNFLLKIEYVQVLEDVGEQDLDATTGAFGGPALTPTITDPQNDELVIQFEVKF